MKSYGAGLLVVLVAFLVGGCGGPTSQPQAPQSTDTPAIAGQPADFTSDDVAFANDMITLYRQTTELTALVPTHSTDPDLIALAADTDAAQAPDLQTVKAFLVQWSSNSDTGSSQGAPGTAVPGMVDDATMARVNALSGKDFDALCLRSMIGLQQGVVARAEAEIAHGSNVDALATAKQLVGSHQAQLARLHQVLANH